MRLAPISLLALLILTWTAPALAARRVALVIGNSAYEHVGRLANPANDATSVATALKEAGFDVVDLRQDLKTSEMRRTLRDFSDAARGADVAVIYYAGHGMEVDGNNYLIPVDAVLERDIDVYDEAFALDRVLATIEPAKQLRLIILDACRDNPFAKTMKRTIASRAIGRGLAKVEPSGPNTLIAFASKAGSVASDGDSGHSPFTTALVKYIARPGLDLRRAFGFVRDDVLKSTANTQEPYVYGSLGGDDVPLVPAVLTTSPAATPQLDARKDYELALQLGTKDGWTAFLAQYRDGFYASLAKGQLNKIAAEEARLAATEKAKLAEEEKARLAAEGARKSEQAKAAAQAKAAEDARIAAERAQQVQQEKVAAAEQARLAGGTADPATASGSDALASDKSGGQQSATLEPQAAKPEPSPADLTKQVQAELRRVGCFAGAIDGDWNDAMRRAVETFNKSAGTKIDARLASLDAVDTIKAKTSRVCPVVCKEDFEAADDNTCERIIRKRPAAERRHPAPSHGNCFTYNGKSYC